MPSPFPGMDPYLENSTTWPDLHQRLIAYSAEALQPQLRPKYIARIGERVALSSFRRAYIPDVLLIRSAPSPYGAALAGGLLVADEPTMITMLEEERRVPFLEIIHHPNGEVVTLIEVLSPANKTGEDRQKYLRKQDDIRNSQVNLVEIDLLGEGQPTTIARLGSLHEPAEWRYIVSVCRNQSSTQIEAYPIPLRQRLPRCRIPLLPEDEDVVLDLPTVFTRCYDIGGYDLLVDYSQPPPVTLDSTDKEWMETLLHEKEM
ncbi:MAG: DUF4058 family protein [Chloroflexi bacterium]|nr:MAG: DUF4058 family protein [Chloroflexota bacterium]